MKSSFSGDISKRNNVYPILQDYGTTVGTNLFHSFSRFNLTQGEIADFQGNQIENIIGRVTGGTSSSINGTIRSSIPGANLFLMNPNGIVFGPNAELDLTGSFHVTTADYLKFGETEKFYADPARSSALVRVNPSAFGFLNARQTRIEFNGSRLNGGAPGSTFSAIGGAIASDRSELQMFGNDVHLIATKSSGEVRMTDSGPDTSSLTTFGRIDWNNSLIDTSADQAGAIRIQGSDVVLNGGLMRANTGDMRGGNIELNAQSNATISGALLTNTSGHGPGGNLSIRAGDTLTIHELSENSKSLWNINTDGQSEFNLITNTFDTGNAGDIALTAKELILNRSETGDAEIKSTTHGKGHGGNITIHADRFLHSGTIYVISNPLAYSLDGDDQVTNAELGSTGNILIDVQSLTMDHASINSITSRSQGNGGNITIQAADLVEITNRSNIGVISEDGGSGHAGNLNIHAKNISIRNTSFDYYTDSESTWESEIVDAKYGTGRGGNVTLQADNIRIRNTSFSGWSDSRGDAGNVVMRASERISFLNTSITSNAMWSGTAGNITIEAPDILMDNGNISAEAGGNLSGSAEIDASEMNRLTSQGVVAVLNNSGTFYSFFPLTSAGTIEIIATSLDMRSGSQINSTGSYYSNAGTISLNASNITVDGYGIDGRIRNPSGIIATTQGNGHAGTISVNADQLTLTHGARIDVSSAGNERAGNLQITARNVLISGTVPEHITLYAADGVVPPGSSGIYSSVSGAGGGGDLSITAESMELSDGAAISVATSGTGDGGNISLDVKQNTHLDHATISANSTSEHAGDAGSILLRSHDSLIMNEAAVTSSAETGGGGGITVEVDTRIHLRHSNISTSVRGGDGNGGNISIDPRFLILDHSHVQANAFGGAGGNVHVQAHTLLQDTSSSMTASSVLGVQGTVSVDTPNMNVVDGLMTLPVNFFDASALMNERCSASGRNNVSSFVIKGRGGLPYMPGDLFASHGATMLPPYAGAAITNPVWAIVMLPSDDSPQIPCTM
ncbi:MAG: filamentous hemagglutinin N-terminal domain-containing protein [Magnetococcales bacterium]|nr:filamentous hemagglutinin N-terminal domain-containing protein [Magnetococcales bacterium]